MVCCSGVKIGGGAAWRAESDAFSVLLYFSLNFLATCCSKDVFGGRFMDRTEAGIALPQLTDMFVAADMLPVPEGGVCMPLRQRRGMAIGTFCFI